MEQNKFIVFCLNQLIFFPHYGERSIGCSNPALYVMGKGDDFKIKALNELGKRLLKVYIDDLGFCDELHVGEDVITGKLKARKGCRR